MSSMRSASSSTSRGHAAQVEHLLAQQLLHAAGRADHDVRRVFQRGELRPERHAAGEREQLEVGHAGAEPAHLLGHLVGEFARGAQHQRLHARAAEVEAMQQGEAEGGGLAAAGGRLRDEVAAVEQAGQAARLHRRHVHVAQGLEALEQRGQQRQGGESGGVVHGP